MTLKSVYLVKVIIVIFHFKCWQTNNFITFTKSLIHFRNWLFYLFLSMFFVFCRNISKFIVLGLKHGFEIWITKTWKPFEELLGFDPTLILKGWDCAMCLSSHTSHCTRFNTCQFSSSSTLTKDPMVWLQLNPLIILNATFHNALQWL